MREIRFHGRGGQGAVTATQLLVTAALYEGKYGQAFPFFGGERRGAPVTAFMRVDDRPINLSCQVYSPDCIVVLDAQLPKFINVAMGLKEGGIAVMNSSERPDEIDLGVGLSKVATVDATHISAEVFGPATIPITNTVMLGAFASATGWIGLESILRALEGKFSGKVLERNVEAIHRAYDRVSVRTASGESHG